VIPHGIDQSFFVNALSLSKSRHKASQETHLLYVSNSAPYKNHIPLVEAVAELRHQGTPITLTLIGQIEGKTGFELLKLSKKLDNEGKFLFIEGPIPHSDLPTFYQHCDICVFASSCENLPVTLLEGMASGLPIACSNKGPMPEVLGEGGLYFDPTKRESICRTLKALVENWEIREKISETATKRASFFTWERCAEKTWQLLKELAKASSISYS
jgi:glycosyltransferase involved in cell wall biosynthesis